MTVFIETQLQGGFECLHSLNGCDAQDAHPAGQDRARCAEQSQPGLLWKTSQAGLNLRQTESQELAADAVDSIIG